MVEGAMEYSEKQEDYRSVLYAGSPPSGAPETKAMFLFNP